MQPLRWIGSSLKDLRAYPEEVRRTAGYALYLAQEGAKHPAAKPLQGFVGAGVLEVIADFDGDTYRVVYTVRLAKGVYVLHAFQKKARKGFKHRSTKSTSFGPGYGRQRRSIASGRRSQNDEQHR